MRVLLLGGTGILSTAVCRRAADKGCDVTVFNRGKHPRALPAGIQTVLGDLREDGIAEVRRKLGGEPFDVVVDFISYNLDHMRKTLEIIDGLCRQYIFISTATAYAPQARDFVYAEDASLDNGGWAYSLRKSECEHSLKANPPPFPYSIVRPYVTYGETRIPYQIAPGAYYTLVNRILTDRPLLIFRPDTVTTLTDVRDFAIGVVGLFLNPKAYGQAVHITSDHAITWKAAAEIIARHCGRQASFVDLPEAYLRAHRSTIGINVDEILGDKGRNMVFDNSKIKALVPEFQGDIGFERGIEETFSYFDATPAARTIDDDWDLCADRLAARFGTERDRRAIAAYWNSRPLGLRAKLRLKLCARRFYHSIRQLFAP